MPEKGRRPEVFGRHFNPVDIRTGSYGDAWFTSALMCLAEKPNLLKKLLVT